ncbi:MAG: peptidylprolyl isomerase, partial [Brevundimonas sp.]
MSFRIATIGVFSIAFLAAGLSAAAQAPAAEWRTVAPENLLVIDTAKGRILVELDPVVAPL